MKQDLKLESVWGAKTVAEQTRTVETSRRGSTRRRRPLYSQCDTLRFTFTLRCYFLYLNRKRKSQSSMFRIAQTNRTDAAGKRARNAAPPKMANYLAGAPTSITGFITLQIIRRPSLDATASRRTRPQLRRPLAYNLATLTRPTGRELVDFRRSSTVLFSSHLSPRYY